MTTSTIHSVRSLCSGLAFAVALLSPAVARAASAFETIPVPRVTIYPGVLISDGMLTPRRIRRGKTARLPIVRRAKDVVGKISRRTLLPGRPILQHFVQIPDLIRRGESSLVIFRSGGLVITNHATALESGASGDFIKLRNVDGGRIVTGLIQADGTVLVGVQ
ncbi:MAG: flagellar basal body P-ring formation chaperone FlgA [Hyphomicrobiaceae bacterium]